jgi:ribonuclease HI
MLHVWCDGSIVDGNPGGRGYTGFVVKDADGQLLCNHSDDLGPHQLMSNNVAEYAAVLSALNWLIVNGYTEDEVQVRTDSQLIVNQLNGVYHCTVKTLQNLRALILSQVEKFPKVTFMWIRREQNKEADTMSKSLQQ